MSEIEIPTETETPAENETPAEIETPADIEKPTKRDFGFEGKLFVGGLHWESTEETIKTYFEQFGEVESVNLKKNTEKPGRHRGFCFVTFSKATDADAVLAKEGAHYIDGRKIEAKSACPPGVKPEERTKKLFVGGLKGETTEEAMIEYFKEFGEIKGKIEFKVDRETQKKRGFCFISFQNEAIVDRIVKKKYHTIAGVRLEVKRAIDKAQQQQNQQGLPQQPQIANILQGAALTSNLFQGSLGGQPVIYITPEALSSIYPQAATQLQSTYKSHIKPNFNSNRNNPYPVKKKMHL